MVVFSIPESERDKRHLLRSTLASMGFGTVSPGVWVAPGLLHDEVARTLEHQGLATFVDLFRARHDGFGSLRDRVASGGTCRRSRRSTPSSSRSTPARMRAGSRPGLPPARRSRPMSRCSPTGAGFPTSTRAFLSSCCRPAGTAARRRSSSPTSMRCCATLPASTPSPRSTADSLQNGDALDLYEGLDVPQAGHSDACHGRVVRADQPSPHGTDLA